MATAELIWFLDLLMLQISKYRLKVISVEGYSYFLNSINNYFNIKINYISIVNNIKNSIDDINNVKLRITKIK